ncbi:hypothetical protein Nepgr_030155 [Nepenthes gracilis]|uniref:Uncharacterized protein n=1 Tax=Nepenthes gracilis TaxID=150966 RepID=A0AAD3TF95_NEPGR|nr:hypothetical protein Nepgr_030155 [Nepenthes gracilis]
MVNSILPVVAKEPSLLVGSDILAQATDNWGRTISSGNEFAVGIPRLDVSPESSSADMQKLEASEAVSMVQLAYRHAADSKLECQVDLAELNCPVSSILLDLSKEGIVVDGHTVDIASSGDLVLPLNAGRVGVEHLGTPDQALIGSSYHGVVVDHYGGDPGSCSSIGMLMRNIDELRKQLGASRARVLEVSYNPGQFLLEGSGSEWSCSELPGLLVISDGLLQYDTLASALISEEHLVVDVEISGNRGAVIETPSPIPADGMSPSSEGGGPPSFFKKSKRHAVYAAAETDDAAAVVNSGQLVVSCRSEIRLVATYCNLSVNRLRNCLWMRAADFEYSNAVLLPCPADVYAAADAAAAFVNSGQCIIYCRSVAGWCILFSAGGCVLSRPVLESADLGLAVNWHNAAGSQMVVITRQQVLYRSDEAAGDAGGGS